MIFYRERKRNESQIMCLPGKITIESKKKKLNKILRGFVHIQPNTWTCFYTGISLENGEKWHINTVVRTTEFIRFFFELLYVKSTTVFSRMTERQPKALAKIAIMRCVGVCLCALCHSISLGG